MPRALNELHPHLWGNERWAVNTHQYCGKVILLKKGFKSSLHYHNVKDETFMCIQGIVLLEVWEKGLTGSRDLVVLKGDAMDAYRLLPGTPHRFRAITDTATVVEFSTTHSEEDVVRLEGAMKLEENDSDN